MRGLSLFLGGVAVGLGVQLAIAQSQNQNDDIVRLNHVGVSVPDMGSAISYYTETLGFPEAFRIENDSGEIALVYVQVSENTFIEIQPANANRPEGISHFGLHVDNMVSVTDRFKESGATVRDIVNSSSGAILSNVIDPEGIRMELAELPSTSLHRQAMDRWEP
jgi:catechol 2,3-dioxygenase-like lactoylglutathione lyase family enzyme